LRLGADAWPRVLRMSRIPICQALKGRGGHDAWPGYSWDLIMLSTSGYVAEQKYVEGQIPSEAKVRVSRKPLGISVLVLAIRAFVVVGA